MMESDSSRPLEGAMRLAFLNADGVLCFNGTRQETRFSFLAPLLVLPFSIATELLNVKWHDHLNMWPKIAAVYVLTYLINLLALFCVAEYAAVKTGNADHWPRFVSAYNWSTIIQMIVFLPLALLYGFQLVNPLIVAPLMLVVAGCLLFYQWFLTRHTLQISRSLALALVMFDLLLGFALSYYSDTIFKLI